jgi:hypothetical protein
MGRSFVHRTSNDITTLKSHMEGYRESYGQVPEAVIADAGYGSQENYDYLAQHHI